MIEFKKNKKIFLLFLSSIILSVVVTYAWFFSFYAVQNIAGEFYYSLDITISESTENIVTLEKALPMSVNDAIENIAPHEFTIATDGDIMINYYVVVKDVTSELVESIDPTNVYYAVNVNGSAFYSVGTLEGAASKRELVFIGTLPAHSSYDISVRIWLGPNATSDGAASYTDPATGIRTYKYFQAQIIVEAD